MRPKGPQLSSWRVCKHLEVAETFLMIDGRQGWPWSEGTMLVWVLIVCCWVGLLLLILHDTTKDDSRCSAIITALCFVVSSASRRLKSALKRLKSRANTLRQHHERRLGGRIGRETGDYDFPRESASKWQDDPDRTGTCCFFPKEVVEQGPTTIHCPDGT